MEGEEEEEEAAEEEAEGAEWSDAEDQEEGEAAEEARARARAAACAARNQRKVGLGLPGEHPRAVPDDPVSYTVGKGPLRPHGVSKGPLNILVVATGLVR